MNEIITTLYIANAGIATIAYLPQCMTLWRMLKTDTVNTSVSLITWLLWAWACSVTLVYAWAIHPTDFAFVTISAVNAVFCLVTAWLTARVHVRARHQHKSQQQQKRILR
ncbi:MAG: hypothetical protein MJA28_12015 [Gammaproteobacteria bacterium]|nr:hypothetical protein [Gammaproteobacteria bacterium]